MSDCCTPTDKSTNHPNKSRCPLNGLEYTEVSLRAITHHIKDVWEWKATASRYFFCDDPECEAVYFGEDGSIILKTQLRTAVGKKEVSGNGALCYCFGVNKADFLNNPATKDYVIAQTKAGLCSCDTSNPSGRCCLKDFPKALR